MNVIDSKELSMMFFRKITAAFRHHARGGGQTMMHRVRFGLVAFALAAGTATLAQSPDGGPPLSAEKQLEVKTSITRYSRGLKPGQELPRHPDKLVVGATVAESVPLVTLPQDAFSEVQKTTTYSFVLMPQGIAVVDPSSRRVVQVID
jgi:hypothetical protein